jgi:sialidase-1
LVGLVCLVTTAVAAAAQPPEPQKIDLFHAGQGGYALYRIPGIIVTAKGTILAYCEARKSNSDWAAIDVLLRRSTDGGRTFDVPRRIAHFGPAVPKNPVAIARKVGREGEQTVNNPVAIADRSGAVHFLYCVEYDRCFYMRSDDDGVTFSRPADVTAAFEGFRNLYDWKVIATGPAHGIQLRTGRLMVPVWLSPGTGGNGHRPSVTATIFSDDGGKTWRAGEIAVPDTAEWVFPNETVAVELADGRVMLNARSESKAARRILTVSPDGATGWSRPRFDEALKEPICMASIVRFSAVPQSDKNRILFANPDNLTRADGKWSPGKSADRKNLSIKLSYDEGQTWPVNKVLEPGASAYSDLAVLPDGTILCWYERAPENNKGAYGRLTLARFTLEWLTDGNDRGAATGGR